VEELGKRKTPPRQTMAYTIHSGPTVIVMYCRVSVMAIVIRGALSYGGP